MRYTDAIGIPTDAYAFIPVKKQHTNRVYVHPTCEDLPLTYADGRLCSVWKLRGFFQRLRFLFTGEVTLLLLSDSQPPCCIIAGDSIGRLMRSSAPAMQE